MGWTCEYKNKTEQVKALLSGWTGEAGRVEVIAHKNVGASAPESLTDAGHLWVLFRETRNDGTVSEFIILYLLQRYARYVQYKDVGPTGGPLQRDVPLAWLDRPLLQDDLGNQYAQDWVKNCRAYWASEAERPKMTSIKTGKSYRMRGGPSQLWAHGGVKDVEYLVCIDSRRGLYLPLYQREGRHWLYSDQTWLEGYAPGGPHVCLKSAKARELLEDWQVPRVVAEGVAV